MWHLREQTGADSVGCAHRNVTPAGDGGVGSCCCLRGSMTGREFGWNCISAFWESALRLRCSMDLSGGISFPMRSWDKQIVFEGAYLRTSCFDGIFLQCPASGRDRGASIGIFGIRPRLPIAICGILSRCSIGSWNGRKQWSSGANCRRPGRSGGKIPTGRLLIAGE